jgi:lipopolysaccharide biosynthesis glycosyltransferase
MFSGEVCDYLQTLKPTYFAVAPEAFKNDYIGINTGVMLMNVENLSRNDRVFRRYVKENLSLLMDNSFDQGAYRFFYKRGRIIRKIIGNKWNKLKPEYNWKPYWGKSAEAKIIHFHGPKPYQTELLLSGEAPEQFKSLKPMMTDAYFEFEREWKLNLSQAHNKT